MDETAEMMLHIEGKLFCAQFFTDLQCLKKSDRRLKERSERLAYIENNKLRVDGNKVLYKKRQSIAVQPYDAIKRQRSVYCLFGGCFRST